MDYSEAGTTRKPNIIVFLVDDMGYSDIGCYGSEIHTPNIDRLASGGVQFTQMYNCARCCPSRASLLTGVYPHQAGMGHMTAGMGPGAPTYQGYLNENCVTIAEVLRDNGYTTIMSGKWHVGGMFDLKKPESWGLGLEGHPLPIQRGFEHFYGTLDGCGSYFFPHTLMRNESLIEEVDDNFYYTDAISRNAVEMIKTHGKSEKPFFLYVAYTAPHWPLHALPEDIEKYRGKYRKGWDQLRKDRHEQMIGLGILDEKWKISPRHEHASAWEDTPYKDWESMRMAVYAAQIDRMDQGVGRIIETIRVLGIEDNTLVMFLSDNGGCAEFLAEDGHVREEIWPMRNGSYPKLGNYPEITPGSEDSFMSYDLPWANASNTPFRLFKHWVHEGGIATPLIAYWPSVIKEHRIFHGVSHVIDIMATCVDVSGSKYPQSVNDKKIHPMEGESFAAVLHGKQWHRDKPVVWEHEGNCAVRNDEWKLVQKYPHDWELYNMVKDRTESENLIKKDKEKAKQLIKTYQERAERCGVIPWDDIKHKTIYQDVLSDGGSRRNQTNTE